MRATKPISHIVAGLIIAGLLIVMSVVISLFMGNSARPGSGWLTYIVIIGGLVLFINQYGKANDFRLGFGDLFSYGFKAMAMVTLVFVIFVMILLYASPEIKESAIKAAREQVESQKGMTQTDIDKNMALMNKYFGAILIGGTILGFAIIGAIGSLIGAAVTKKNQGNHFEQLDQLDQPQS